jgi:hypothetical protein
MAHFQAVFDISAAPVAVISVHRRAIKAAKRSLYF